MSTGPHATPPRPTLEDLLRFKRAERPSPEFWAEFDRGLRQKQLAALMDRPQAWARVRPVLFRGLRWAVPAAAAAAVALVILQIPRGATPRAEQTVAVSVSQPAAVVETAIPTTVAQVAVVMPVQQAEPTDQEQPVATVAQTEPTPSPAPEVSVAAIDRTLPWSASSLGFNAPSADFGASAIRPVRLAARETRRPNSSWTSRFSEMARELSAEQSDVRVMQLASLEFPSSNRLVAASPAAGSAQLAGASDRSGRALSDREFRELDSQLGAKRSGFSIRF